MVRQRWVAGLGAVVALACAAAAQTVSLPTLLGEMMDRGAVARLPEPWYACVQASSYDRASVSPGHAETWFANADADKFIREEQAGFRREWVMMEAEGPGAVVRIWSANPKGNLRIYLDGSAAPAIEGPMEAILGGQWSVEGLTIGGPLSQTRSRGWNLYLPIPYAKSCKITSDEPGFYYQVNYRTYAPEAAVETFTPGSLARSAALVQRVQERLAEPWPRVSAGLKSVTVSPGDSVELGLPAGPGTVREVVMQLADDQPREALRWLVLEGEFDGEQTVWCPVGDFFLSGPLANAVNTWTNHVDPESGLFRSGWLMPYERSGALRIRNVGDTSVTVGFGVSSNGWSWDERSMHFHAHWRQEGPIHTRPMQDWNYIEATGTGVYVGDVLSVSNPVTDWWGEGDEKIYVDGEQFPSHFGTGTEDYYGYAWCSPEVFQGPFHAQPRCDGPGNYGHTTVARVRLLDGIPFRHSIRTDMEVWHWAECDVAYGATTFLYMRPGGRTNRGPAPEEASRGVLDPAPLPPPFTIEGAVECEDLEILGASEGMPLGEQDMGGFARDKWSGNAHLWAQGRQPGDYVELAVPAPSAHPCELTLHATRSWDYGVLQCSVNGVPAGGAIDTFSGRQGVVEPTGPIALGVFEPHDGVFVVRVEVVGGNLASGGARSFFGLDAIVVEEVGR
ncbi:MAG TPA: glycoside hydrolase family 172 protein [Phycisphaerales bacterium]|nr:glycoside hydrolase family 172 protein [Phycisphaerales bacterium]